MNVSTQLESWNEGAARRAILNFVAQTTTPGSPDFVAPADRVATFDNDGTLWLEKPMYIQLQHGLRAIGKAAAENPALRERQPFKAVYEQDMGWLSQAAADYAKGDLTGVIALVTGLGEVFEGMAPEVFAADVFEFLSNVQDPRFKAPYKQLTYKPMVELVRFLQDNDFQVYIISGGGRDFMRAVSEEIYGIPRDRTIGSSVTFVYSEDAQGVAQVVRTKELELPINDGQGKPVYIHRAIGRRPILAAGNSNGDIHMLKYAKGSQGASLALLVHHDDAVREYGYDDGTERALQLAPDAGWIVVSMKEDWKTVF